MTVGELAPFSRGQESNGTARTEALAVALVVAEADCHLSRDHEPSKDSVSFRVYYGHLTVGNGHNLLLDLLVDRDAARGAKRWEGHGEIWLDIAVSNP